MTPLLSDVFDSRLVPQTDVFWKCQQRRQFDDAGPIPGLLEVLVSCQRCLGQQSKLTEVAPPPSPPLGFRMRCLTCTLFQPSAPSEV